MTSQKSLLPGRASFLALTVAVVTLVLGGCGSGNDQAKDGIPVQVGAVENPLALYEPGHRPDAQGVAEVIAVIGPAVVRGDGSRVCSLMSRSAQERLAQAQRTSTCPSAVDAVATELTATERDHLRHLSAEAVTVRGTTATASLTTNAKSLDAVIFGKNPTYKLSEERWALQ